MAKAKQAPAVSLSADLYEWAAEVLRLRFDEVVSFGGAVIVPWNVNGVHDMRVAIRRQRSALRDFVQVINEKPLKRVKDDLKKIADSLGTVRDQDVSIIALEELAAETDNASIKDGIGELIKELRTGRERAHSRLRKTLASISIDELRDRFSTRIEDSLRQQELFSPGSLSEAGRTVIEARLWEFCEIGTAIYEPFDGVQLHDLRIAAKHLRYSIELFAVCWGDEIAGFAAELAKLQSNLGEVHDCDLWIETLTKRLKHKNTAKTPNASEAAAWLLSKFVGKRSKEYRSALELWSKWQANKFVETLRIVLSHDPNTGNEIREGSK